MTVIHIVLSFFITLISETKFKTTALNMYLQYCEFEVYTTKI